MVTTSLMKILNFFEIFEILKCCEHFEMLFFNIFFGNFRILKFLENFEILWNFMKTLFFLLFFFYFSLIDDEVRRFRINIKLLSNPVAELKIRENDSHCRSIVLKTMDRSIVKQLEKEKNSYFNVENFVVMFIYWGTIIVLIE
jgi:hypothetical protein